MFTATTDAEGRFEFQPLRPGKYKIRVDPVGPFQADDEEWDVKNRSCTDITLGHSSKAEISGHVRYGDGTPVASVSVILLDADESGYNSDKTDSKGYFRFDSQRPGKYKVGIVLPGSTEWNHGSCGGAGCNRNLPSGILYYPSTTFRDSAFVIDLATDEKRKNLDFTLPKP
jgi:hypothetical protein